MQKEGALQKRIWAAVLAASVLSAGAAMARPTPEQKCMGAKLKAVAKLESGLLRCQSNVAATNNASALSACRSKAAAKFSAAFGKAGACLGVQTRCNSIADDCERAVAAAMTDTFPSKCEAAKRQAAARLARGELNCYAKAAKTGSALAATCLSKLIEKFSATLTVAGTCPDGGAPQVPVEDICVQPAVTTGSGDVVTAVCPPTNNPPTVDAGASQTISLDALTGAATATLAATVQDDGLPSPPASLTLTWTLLSGPTAAVGASFQDASAASTTVTLAETGIFVLQLQVGDGVASATDTVAITVLAATNLPPSLLHIDDTSLPIGTTLSVRATADDDNPKDTLAYSLLDAPAGATLDPASSGRILWSPTTPSELGVHNFTVHVEDQSGLADEESFTVTVTAANQPPVFGPVANETIPAGIDYQRVLAATDADAGDMLTYYILDAPVGMTLGGAGADTLGWATTNADVGVHAVKLRVVDSGSPNLDDVAIFLLTVAVNTAPVAADDSYHVGEGRTLTVASLGVLANDIDPDADTLAAMKLSDPDLGSLTAFRVDGSFEYQAPAVAPDAAFAIAQKWRGGGYSQYRYALPLIGDVNKDGYPDLVMSVYNNTHTAISGLDGSVIWNASHNKPGGLNVSDCRDWLANSNARVLADIDDDGDFEYVVPTACDRDNSYSDRIIAYDKEGNPKWISPQISRPHPDACPPGGCATPPDPLLHPSISLDGMNPSVARLSAGASPTLLLHLKIASIEGSYVQPNGVYKRAGCRAVSGRAIDEGVGCRATILLSGIDGSVQDVLVAPNPGNFQENYNRYPWYEPAPFAADLEGDGSVEIISGGDVWKQVGGNWTLAWQTAVDPAEAAVADLDGDGIMEVIHLSNREGDSNAATRFSGYIIYSHDGVELRRIPLSPTYYSGYFTVADVDGDGSPDFVNSSQGYVQALRSDGRVLWVFALPSIPTVSTSVDTRSGKGNVQVYDLDGDGVAEVIVAGTDGLHILDGRTGTQKASYLQPAYANSGSPSNLAIPASYVVDADNDGHADVMIVSRRDGTNCNTTPPDCNIAAVIQGAANDWLPGPKIFHQTDFRPGDVDDSGHVLFNTTVSDSFRNPAQLGTPKDPRAAKGTSFTYAATDGAMDSAASVFVEITPANRPPVITSIPPSALLSSAPYTPAVYQITAVDPDPGDTITYELVVSNHPVSGPPNGITLDPATGLMSIFVGPCGAGCTYDSFLVIVAAVDQLGARTQQAFQLAVSPIGVAVPNVVGQQFAAAQQALTAVNLSGRLLSEAYSAQPAGAVIAQGTAPAIVVAKGATVTLTVSLGLAPVVMPNVVGLPQGAAAETLVNLGFDVSVVRAYSTATPRGEVSAQSPAAGETVSPLDAQITMSLGSGLRVRTSRDYATANQTIDIGVLAVNSSDVETQFAGADLAIEAVGDLHLGAAPGVAGYTITPATDTRGTWRVTATDPGTGRSGSAEFTVVQSADADTNIDAAAFAQFSETLASVLVLLGEAAEAGTAGDDVTLNARVTEAVLLWRSIDQEVLRLSSPFAPEGGLPPRESDMAGFGVSETFEDAVNLKVLEGSVVAVRAMVDGLREATTTLPELAHLLRDVVVAAAPIESMAPGEYGMVAAQPEYAVLAAHLIPDWVDTLMNDLGATVGLAPVVPTELNASALDAGALQAMAATRAFVPPGRGRPRSTISEQLTAFAVNAVVEQLNTLQKLQKDVMKQAFSGVMIVAVASHLRAALTTSELVEVVAGASLSFRRFYAPYTIVEGFGFDTKYPQLNEVVLLGPDTVAPGIELFEAIKGAKFDTLYASIKTLKDGHDKIKGFIGGADEAYANGLQVTHFGDQPCIFTTAPGCTQLIFPSGFYSVYSYEPPFGFGTLTGIPLPIITLVRSGLTGEYSFATPPFIPFKPGQDQ